MSTITWLHLSDLHARARDVWDSRTIIDSLVKDLSHMQSKYGLRPDFVCFTGDLAFGAVAKDRMEDQYRSVRLFLDAVRSAFTPPLEARDLYLVPGNHDIDRGEVTPDQTSWLRSSRRTLDEILAAVRDNSKQWRSWLDRLHAYRTFLTSSGLSHLQPDDPRLLWTDARSIADHRVGIVGLNSAWSAADDEDKGRLWCGTEWQISEAKNRMGPVDISIALIHHPSNWFTGYEDPTSARKLRQAFNVTLHGHEHLEWVDVGANGSLQVSAGACYQCSWMNNGYNIVHLDTSQRTGNVYLRKWDPNGSGWTSLSIAGHADDGIWPLKHIQWLRPPSVDGASASLVHAVDTGNADSEPTTEAHYTQRFCKSVIEQNDTLELFGCNIPRELQRHQLSVAYVSLSLTPSQTSLTARDEDSGGDEPSRDSGAAGDESVSFETLLDSLSSSKGRLLVFGPAGAGKSTLLRWCATQSAHTFADPSRPIPEKPAQQPTPNSSYLRTWRARVPILVRLRDCKDGIIPPAEELPRFLAKHLPTAPRMWITNLLESGNVLVLFDGVDEVHQHHRELLATEISAFIQAFPACMYVVTTRPGAVEQGWLSRLEFAEAHVEAMTRQSREDFIQKWFRSAELELRQRPRSGEDLVETAQRLNQELAEQPELAQLAANPLLCAMICALFRERQERLPETSPELCEALCHMLLHRRERETPGLAEAHFFETWRSLHYSQKRGLLSDLAWFMVTHEVSSLDETDARRIVEEGLVATPGRSVSEADDALQALLERSGLLRPTAADRIEFLHNTLKEYLAASVALERGQPQLLIDHARDPAWQPVILFALAQAPELFSTAVVAGIVSRASRPSKAKRATTKLERRALQEEKATDFFLLRCRAAAKRLSPDLSNEIDQRTRNLLPPANMNEANALAQIGARILVYADSTLSDPEWWSKQTVPMCVRSLRVLRGVSGPRAASILRSIRDLPRLSQQLHTEWLLACQELCPGDKIWPFTAETEVYISNSYVHKLAPLANEKTILALYMAHSLVADISEIVTLDFLVRLNAYGTQISDFSRLRALRALRHLNIGGPAIFDLSFLQELSALESLSVKDVSVRDWSSLASLHLLTSLDIQESRPSDISFATGMRRLQKLVLRRCEIESIEAIRGIASIRVLDLDGTAVRDIAAVSGLSELVSIALSNTPVENVAPLRSLQMLRVIGLNYARLATVADLTDVPHLASVFLQGAQIEDWSSLACLKGIKNLDLDASTISNCAPLAELRELRSLDLRNTSVEDISPLASLENLQTLFLSNTKVENLKTLENLPSLHQLFVGDSVPRSELFRFARSRPNVSIVVNHRMLNDDERIIEWSETPTREQ